MNNYKESNFSNTQDNGIHKKIRELASRIHVLYNARVEIQDFSSGAMTVDIFYLDKLFVISYSPSYGFGVDDIKEGDGFNIQHDFYTAKIDLVERQIHELIKQYERIN